MERVLTVGGGHSASRPISDFMLYQQYGNKYFVNNLVSATGNGLSWAYAFATIAEAVALAVAGDKIFIYGDGSIANQYNEAVSVAVQGVEFIGCGLTPFSVVWTAPDTVAPCLTVNAVQGVGVGNIRFRPPVGQAAVSLVGAADHFKSLGCRYQGQTGSYYGIQTDGGQSDVYLIGNEFFYLNTAGYGFGVYGSGYASAEPSGWVLDGNIFHSNLNHIVCRMRQSVIKNGEFAGKGLLASGAMGVVTKSIDISGATGGCNIVTKNFLGGTYSIAGGYTPGTDDEWAGNFGSAGVTTVNPA